MTTQVDNATTPGAANTTKVVEEKEASPFHVLMLPDGETMDSRRKVDESLQHDYLGKRYEAYKALKQGKEREDDPVWSGASTAEKWLIWCCEMPEISAVDQPEYTLPGALRRDRVVKFVGYLALYCHDVISRALAISILERTLEADLPAMQTHEEAERAAKRAAAAAMGSTTISTRASEADTRRDTTTESSPTTRNRKRTRDGAMSRSPTQEEVGMTEAVLPRKPDRLWQFLAAGGLKILDQWVDDASKPIPAPKAPPKRATSAEKTKESPTGALLLPLLDLLRYLPIDKEIVKQSKINRLIRKLSKDIDAIVATKKSKKMTHPRAGGLQVVQVQEALNELKTAWNAREKAKLSSERPPDPFQAVNEALEQRLAEMEDFQSGKEGSQRPAWLVKALEETARKPSPAVKKKPSMSTEEMNRIDHKNERNRRLKDDLQKAEQERRDYQKRLRDIRAKHEANAQILPEKSRNRVQWRDGEPHSHFSTTRNREKLEQVFIFSKDTNAAEGLVTEEEEEEVDMIVDPDVADSVL
eukprot:scaffold1953_cov176-Amphora_coffeaeformis.AAC.32